MFDKIFPWAFFFNWMPYPRRFSVLGTAFVFWYGSYYKKYEDAVIAYYRSRLSELDPAFRVGEAGLEVVQRRQKAIEQGIGPMDPEYPTLRDVLEEQ